MPIIILVICVLTLLVPFCVIAINSTNPDSPRWIRYIFPDKGTRGEMAVAAILEQLPEEYHVFNDIYIHSSGRSVQIDHVVISPYGIFSIETKNYNGWIFGGEKSEFWTQNLYGKKYKFRNPIKQNLSHAIALANVLHVYQSQITPLTVFTGNGTLKTNTSSAVIYENRLRNVILGFAEPIFAPKRVDSLINTLTESIITDENKKQLHIQSVRNTIYRQNQLSSHGQCPRCYGRLVWRQGKYGGFWGCESYPRCRFTKR
mgnify:CR=1 FL=1